MIYAEILVTAKSSRGENARVRESGKTLRLPEGMSLRISVLKVLNGSKSVKYIFWLHLQITQHHYFSKLARAGRAFK